MKPTKEQLADPKWWQDNVPSVFDYAYTTGPDWKYSELSRGDICFGDSNGFCPNEESGELENLVLGLDGWVILAKRPEPEKWKPEIGVECCGNTTDAAGIWSWQKVELLKDMGNGEFACYTENKILRFVDQFRPIKTQREEFVEEAKSRIKNMDADDIILSGKLYDAGCRFDLTEKDSN